MNSHDELLAIARARAMCADGTARAVRRAARLTLREVAAAVGAASAATVYRWEKGERSPRGALALRYALLLEELVAR